MKRLVLIPILLVFLSISAFAGTEASDVTVSKEDFPSNSDADRNARALINRVQDDPDKDLREKVYWCAGQARMATRPFGRIDANFNPFWKEGSPTEKIIVKGNAQGKSAYFYCMDKMKDRTFKKKVSTPLPSRTKKTSVKKHLSKEQLKAEANYQAGVARTNCQIALEEAGVPALERYRECDKPEIYKKYMTKK